MSTVSIVREDRLSFHAGYGLDLEGTPREDSFCSHAIQDPPRPLVVPDARDDERFDESPLVQDHGVRFYAGAPLLVGDARVPLGTLCVLDDAPRRLAGHHVHGLQALAEHTARRLERQGTPAQAFPDPDSPLLLDSALRGPLLRLGRTLNRLDDRLHRDEEARPLVASAWEEMQALHVSLDALSLAGEETPEGRVNLDAIVDELARRIDDERADIRIVAPRLPHPPGERAAIKRLFAEVLHIAIQREDDAPQRVRIQGDETATGWRFTLEARSTEGTRTTDRDEVIRRSLNEDLTALGTSFETRLVLARLIADAHGGTLGLLDADAERIRFSITLDQGPNRGHAWDPP